MEKIDINYNFGSRVGDLINTLEQHYNKYGFDSLIEEFEKKFLESKDSRLCFLFAALFDYADVDALADVVIDNGDETIIYDFICDVNGYDIEHFEDKLIQLGNLSLLVNFARKMQGKFDNSRISNIIFGSGDAKYNYLLAKDVCGVDIKLHGQAVAKSGDAKYCYTYARDVDKENFVIYQDVVAQSGDAKWCYYFMKDIVGADVSLLDKIIIESGDVEYNYLACYISGTDIESHRNVVMNSNNELYINKLKSGKKELSLEKKRI